MRVEIIPGGWYESPEYKRGDGSPTIDVCCDCVKAFTESEPLPEEIAEQYHPESLTGSTDVAHPPYEDDDYECFLCGKRLDDEDA